MKTWRLDGRNWIPQAFIPVEDRAVRYGMSIFESIAIYAGRALFFEAHLIRLAEAAKDNQALIPEISFDCTELPNGLLRLYFTAGAGKFSAPFCGSVYALFEEAEVGCGFSPLRLMTSPAPYLPNPGGWKTGNYWQNVNAQKAAHLANCDEALLFNPAGMVVSGSMTNVFFRIDHCWVTPTREAGARHGVVREWVMQKLSVSEGLLNFTDVSRCQECFLTNSRIGIRAAAEIDGRPLMTNIAGLETAYREEILRS